MSSTMIFWGYFLPYGCQEVILQQKISCILQNITLCRLEYYVYVVLYVVLVVLHLYSTIILHR